MATTVGQGGRTWRAYLSVERDASSNNQPVNSRDRIGAGPWYNANGALIANSLTELHARTGDAALFLDERGQRINGQWTGSPTPNQHDILTGSNADGTLMQGCTCGDWTSSSESGRCVVIVEFSARQSELRRHRSARWWRALLLFCAVNG